VYCVCIRHFIFSQFEMLTDNFAREAEVTDQRC
jgi:hypothetical protein